MRTAGRALSAQFGRKHPLRREALRVDFQNHQGATWPASTWVSRFAGLGMCLKGDRWACRINRRVFS